MATSISAYFNPPPAPGEKETRIFYSEVLAAASFAMGLRDEDEPGRSLSRGAEWMLGAPEEDGRRSAHLLPAHSNGLGFALIDEICAALAELMDAVSSYTYRHSQSVSRIAEAVASEMGLDRERIRLVRRAGLLHDIGKIRVPDSILHKPGGLQGKEREILHDHARLTKEILSRISAFEEIAVIAGAHHERLDGSGYPDRLVGEEIPLEARILAVADVYDALTSDRPYRRGMTQERAIALIRSEAPHRLDAECCEALVLAVTRGNSRFVQ